MNEAIPDLDGVIRGRLNRAWDHGCDYGANEMKAEVMELFAASQREQWTKGEIIQELRALRGMKE